MVVMPRSGKPSQRCTATSRIIVQKGVYRAFVEKFVERARKLEREVDSLKARLASGEGADWPGGSQVRPALFTAVETTDTTGSGLGGVGDVLTEIGQIVVVQIVFADLRVNDDAVAVHGHRDGATSAGGR